MISRARLMSASPKDSGGARCAACVHMCDILVTAFVCVRLFHLDVLLLRAFAGIDAWVATPLYCGAHRPGVCAQQLWAGKASGKGSAAERLYVGELGRQGPGSLLYLYCRGAATVLALASWCAPAVPVAFAR